MLQLTLKFPTSATRCQTIGYTRNTIRIALVNSDLSFRARQNLFPHPRDLYPGRDIPTTPILGTPRPLLDRQGHETFDPSWGRGFGRHGFGNRTGPERSPCSWDRYMGLLPSHNARATDIHIQGRSTERNCAGQQARSISRCFFGCVSIIFRRSEYI